uniref:ATP synthase subunit gamma, mitochondrial n=3 Tax=Ogataea TaxID=461281 RepID=ATPG_PICAN|nr:RecName: Full=ATP synthase subunit gamma, mitochondrial; AltName: Full=F-ATPase gamma subunit [Ogataea angusta]5LQX_G Chain G, ATP synthase gamma subunit [Ogataea angusta]5LQY_G Chain G, ATP synthase gamma subunit [Ogataea angusta]5LQZ_G Chain G, ATP synthase gamma subunit [Ogataea angusta]
ATLREIETRLKSIKNIEKITNTMKVVASTRMGRAQRAMASSRAFREGDSDFFATAETSTPETAEKTLIIAVSSDKGLCGSIHSQIAKATRAKLQETPNADVVTIGDKIKAQMLRTHSSNVVLSFNGVGKEAPTFWEASLIADEIRKLGDYDKIEVMYNKFVSGVAFEPSVFPSFSPISIEESPKLSEFELEEDQAIPTSLSQISLTNAILNAMAEGYASEISARRNAMDNASKNAGEMINKYSILYNRTRQAVITNELVDIITGASSLD